MKLTKCIGIISYLPDIPWVRQVRMVRITSLFKQLNELWPDIDILVIAQNWQKYQPPEIKNKVIKFNYDKALGILSARKILRQEFLKLNYDYIIMLDDDIKIIAPGNSSAEYIELLDAHPTGFCFRRPFTNLEYDHSNEHPYGCGQFNLCAISRFIYEKEPLVNIDIDKNEGFEDSIYACLLYHKYPEYDFEPPKELICDIFNYITPTTWGGHKTKKDLDLAMYNTWRIQTYIANHKELPQELLNERT